MTGSFQFNLNSCFFLHEECGGKCSMIFFGYLDNIFRYIILSNLKFSHHFCLGNFKELQSLFLDKTRKFTIAEIVCMLQSHATHCEYCVIVDWHLMCRVPCPCDPYYVLCSTYFSESSYFFNC